LGGACLALGLAYWWWTARHDGSPLRYLVAPVIWLGVAIAVRTAMDFDLGGQKVGRPTAAQFAVVVMVMAATAVLARVRSGHRLAPTVVRDLLVGGPIAALVLVLSASVEGWPVWPLAVGGLAVAVALEALATVLRPAVVGVGQVLALAGTSAALAAATSVGWGGMIGVAALTGVGELSGWRRPHRWCTVAALVGAGATAVSTLGEPAPLVTAFSTVWVWAAVRRAVPGPWSFARPTLGCAAVAAPVVAVFGLFSLAPYRVALLVTAAAVVGVALVRRLPLLVDDALWLHGVPSAAVATLVLALASSWPPGDAAVRLIVVVVATSVVATSSWHAAVRAWLTVAAGFPAVLLAGELMDLSRSGQLIAVAAGAAALVATAALRRDVAAGHVGLAGHIATPRRRRRRARAVGRLPGAAPAVRGHGRRPGRGAARPRASTESPPPSTRPAPSDPRLGVGDPSRRGTGRSVRTIGGTGTEYVGRRLARGDAVSRPR
jgi:hypothetical protein